MDLHKLNPWNWFKHEENQNTATGQIPVKREANELAMPARSDHGLHPMLRLHQDIDRMFDDVFRGFGFPSLSTGFGSGFQGAGGWLQETGFRANLNVSSDNDAYQISVEAPGLTEADFSVEVRGDVLTIQGQKQEEQENKERQFYRVERSYGSFQRTLALPEDALADDIQANLKQGVLTITIPRKALPEGSSKKITINT
ncbi:Hsp20/alpha crystallin family protein [Oceanicoccus sp. KOV_DT_Chl]|uniref:Hsp20/alpha crystallin family protein n=1 Tax=Oceanicoccus sp. KOV_DT_Chl TaxID=1904639 RepID=UPI000C7AE594|nr:Hsp20/alpha crystallin family protein [Oceanicoccus sp. KOV_DT_Chl]